MQTERPRPEKTAVEDHLIASFSNLQSSGYMKVSICVALYITLFLLWSPGFQVEPFELTEREVKRSEHRRKVLRPPAERSFQYAVTRSLQGKKTPMPDISPYYLEPDLLIKPPVMPAFIQTPDWELAPAELPAPENKVVAVGQRGVAPPVFTRRVRPEYPKAAAKLRIQGYVILQAILRKSGIVDDIQVMRGLGRGQYGFEEAAISSLKQWQFDPGTVNGRPADIRMNLRVDFILN